MAEKVEKKRKRQSDGVETPNKKLATGGSERIQVIHAEDTGLHPVLLGTSGIKAPTVPFKAYAKPRKSSKQKSENGDIRPSTHDLLLQSSQHPRLDYTAVPSPIDDQLSHYVAIYDPAKRVLQLAPAHHLQLRSTLRAKVDEEAAAAKGRTMASQREALGQEFGTKKAKKAINSKSTNAITGDESKITDVQSAILESVGETNAGLASKLSEKEQSDAALASKPIPWPRLDASEVESIYTFDTLVPPNDARLVKLKDWTDAADDDSVLGFKHQFPQSRFAFLAKSNTDVTLRLKALKYLTLLLEFRDLATGGGRGPKKLPKKEQMLKKLPSHRWPTELVESVRRRFTNETGGEMGKWQMDNLATHICALALFADHWETDIWLLKEDMKLDLKELTQYFLELGARVHKVTEPERGRRGLTKAQAAATRIARLHIPLDFPKVRMGRRA